MVDETQLLTWCKLFQLTPGSITTVIGSFVWFVVLVAGSMVKSFKRWVLGIYVIGLLFVGILTWFNHYLFADPLSLINLYTILTVAIGVGVVFYQQSGSQGFSQRLILFAATIVGMIIALTSINIALTVVAIEIQSLCLVCSIALYPRTQSIKGAIQYFLLNCLSMVLLLSGLLIIYNLAGAIDYDVIKFELSNLTNSRCCHQLAIAQILIVLSFCCKLGLVPVHLLMTRVYEQCHTMTLLMVGVVGKISSFLVILTLFNHVLGPLTLSCRVIIYGISLVSCFMGAVSAINEKDPHRFLGFSGASQLGFAFCFLSLGSHDTFPVLHLYLWTYALSTMVFLLIVSMHQSDQFHRFVFGTDSRLNYRPIFLIVMAWIVLGFAGIPFTPGFAPKVLCIQKAIQHGFGVYGFGLLLSSVLGAWGYISLVHTLVFGKKCIRTQGPHLDTLPMVHQHYHQGHLVFYGLLVLMIMLTVAPRIVLRWLLF